MKLSNVLKILGITAVTAVMSAQVSAAEFKKVLTYSDNIFSDVSESEWFAPEVKTAYELGFMNGKSDNLFVPDQTVTVAEGVTMVSRVYAIYSDKSIPEKQGENWYDMYTDYAAANGIIEKDQFDNYDRSLLRWEMAVLFENAMPDGYYTAKNSVTSIPDVAKTEDYYDELIRLYNAGVVKGSDDYGSFYPNNSIKRSETAAIINRVAIPENRLTGTLADYGERPMACYLIDDFTMASSVKNKVIVRSGWRYQNNASRGINTSDASSSTLNDSYDDGYVSINRDILTQTKGVLTLEAIFSVQTDGARMYFTDSDGNIAIELCTKDGVFHVIGKSDNKTDFALLRENYNVLMKMDLDAKKTSIVINGQELGSFDMSDSFRDISRMWYATTEEGKTILNTYATHLYTNFAVNDTFRLDRKDSSPFGWTVSGEAKVKTINSDPANFYDCKSVNLAEKSRAVKSFDAVSGKFIYETYVLAPDEASGYVTLKSGGNDALRIDITADGKFMCGNTLVRSFNRKVWQYIRIEGDTDNGTALIKINGKACVNVGFSAESVDSAEIGFDGGENTSMWFDSVQMYKTYDYVDYCPTPVPATDDDYYVAMSICSLWHEGTHFGWDSVSPYNEIQSVLGYYDEGNSEVADWEIKFMVEHGIDFQHFCWYMPNGTTGGAPLKEPRLSDALHHGYFNAKYSDMQKFSIMWENNGCSETSSDFFYNEIWPYWTEWYFSDSRYMSIDNKALLTIYRYSQFVKNMGGEEQAKKVVDFMKQDIKNYGYDGLILLFSDTGSNAANNKLMSSVGADGLVSYTFGENSYSSSYQIQCMNNAYNANGIDLLPSVGVGFNDIGWTEGRTPNATTEEHTKVLEWAKNEYLPKIGERSGEDWKSKFVFMTTWNEYGEGHYIMPANLNGFGYLDDIRSTFSSVSGADDKAHSDITPTDSQLSRLGTIYPAKHTPMRRQYLEQVETTYPKERLIGWDFDNAKSVAEWKPMMNCSPISFDEAEKALTARSTSSDAAIIPVEQITFKAGDAAYLHLNMMTDTATTVTLYFKTLGDSDWSAAKGYSISSIGDGKYHDLYVELAKNVDWTGNIIGVRFDPNSTIGNFGVKTLEFLKPDNENKFSVNVDSEILSFTPDCIKRVGDEIFLAGNPSLGFYSAQNMYYECNRWDETLMVEAPNHTRFDFTVGSDSVLVNGAEKKIESPIELYDGLVMVPIKFIYDNSGIKYTQSEAGLDVVIRPGNYKETVESRVVNEYEFKIEGDTEDWAIGLAQGTVSNDCFSLTATPASSTKSGFDAQITNKKVSIDTNIYKSAEVRIRCTFTENPPVDGNFTIYFATNSETGLSESKTARVNLADVKPDEEGFYTLLFDFSKNEKWIGRVNTIRFDPTNSGGFYEIDYIRMIVDESAEESAKLQADKEAERKALYNAALDGAPFYIENSDLEDVSNASVFYSHNADISIADDPLKKGNHALLVSCNKEAKSWVYVFQNTVFKPGAEYTVEFDYYAVSDTDGKPVEHVLPQVNLKYDDIKNGVMTEKVDHNKTVGNVSTSDGWVHLSFTHTISTASTSRGGDAFTIFTSPLDNSDGSYKNIIYMIDNVKVTVK